MPLLYPFHAWRHAHNLHHAHTNSLELDTDWRPIPEAVYRRMSLRDRIIYVSVRTWAVWAGTIHYWAAVRLSGLRTYPKKEMRRDVRRSHLVCARQSAAHTSQRSTYFTGWQGLLLYFVAPWFAIHAWFSITTLMHHSSEDIPYLPDQYWTRNASRLLVTTDYVYPRWLLFLTHNISLHTAHHVSPGVPFYNLPKAQAALKQAYPGMMRVEKATVPKLWNILRNCRFYDPISGLYSTCPMQRADSLEGVRCERQIVRRLPDPRASDHAATGGYVQTTYSSTPADLGSFPDDLCPLGASRVELAGIPRVAAAYVWGSDEPTVLALHGWGTDSTTMSTVVDAVLDNGESTVCFDAPGHGASPGSHATMKEYAHATLEVLQRFPSIHTIVAHSLASIAAVSAVARSTRATCAICFCSLRHARCRDVLERWATQRDLPRGLVAQIYRELERRDGVPVSHWDIRTLGLPPRSRYGFCTTQPTNWCHSGLLPDRSRYLRGCP